MDEAVRKLFERYESGFNRALAGTIDMDEIASLYAAEFIASAPMGVRAGRNDAEFRQVMEQGYAHYRTIGTRRMSIRELRLSPIDALHCIAHVGWTAVYARQDEADISIDFEVHIWCGCRTRSQKSSAGSAATSSNCSSNTASSDRPAPAAKRRARRPGV